MSEIQINYLGDLRTKSEHLDSNHTITTDAPKDNQGLGRKFSPTDLVASALGSCLLTVMGIIAERNEIKMIGSYIEIKKKMSENPRRISDLILNVKLKEDISDKYKTILKRASTHCPVHNSLNKNINIEIIFK